MSCLIDLLFCFCFKFANSFLFRIHKSLLCNIFERNNQICLKRNSWFKSMINSFEMLGKAVIQFFVLACDDIKLYANSVMTVGYRIKVFP